MSSSGEGQIKKNVRRGVREKIMGLVFSFSFVKLTPLVSLSETEDSLKHVFEMTASLPYLLRCRVVALQKPGFLLVLTQQKSSCKQKEETEVFWIDRCQGTPPSNFLVD